MRITLLLAGLLCALVHAVHGDTELYDILGVKLSATDAQIKQAYRKLAKEFHPDKNSDPNAHDRFQDISEGTVRSLSSFFFCIDPVGRKKKSGGVNGGVQRTRSSVILTRGPRMTRMERRGCSSRKVVVAAGTHLTGVWNNMQLSRANVHL